MDTRVYEYGNPDSSTVLLQMVDDHDLAVIENEVAAIRKTADDFRLFAIKVKNWNLDLSPWNAPAVFGKEGFGGGASETLTAVGENIRRAYDCLAGQGVDSVLEWNKGNHFKEPDIRTAKAFAWLIGN